MEMLYEVTCLKCKKKFKVNQDMYDGFMSIRCPHCNNMGWSKED